MSEFNTQLAALTAANSSLQTAIGKMNNLMTASETADVTIEGQAKPSVAKQVKTKTDPAVDALNSATTAQNTATEAFNSLMTASETTDVTVSGVAVASFAKQVAAKAKNAYQIAVINGFGGTEAQWLDSLRGSDGADAGSQQYAIFNGTSSFATLDATYSLAAVGDYVKFKLRVSGSYVIAKHIGLIGLNSGNQSHVFGFYAGGGAQFSMRASDSAWVLWTPPVGSRFENMQSGWTELELRVTSATGISLYINSVLVSERQVAAMPFSINSIGRGYYPDFAEFYLKDFALKSGSNFLECASISQLPTKILTTAVTYNYESVDVRGNDGVDGVDGLDGLNSNEVSRLDFNGTNAQVYLPAEYQLANVGDWLELEVQFTTSPHSLSDHLGIIGKSAGYSSHVAGFLSTGLSLRASDSTWVTWSTLLYSALSAKRGKIKLAVTATGEITAYFNGVSLGAKQSVNLPFRFDNIANAYNQFALFRLYSIAWQTGQGANNYTDVRKIPGATDNNALAVIEQDSVQVVKVMSLVFNGAGIFRVFIPSASGYAEVIFKRAVIPATGCDVWEINQVFSCDENKVRLLPLTSIGAWECAIKQTVGGVGKSDFVGSSMHGDDELTSYSFAIDGVLYQNDADLPSIPTEAACSVFEAWQESTLYECDTNKATIFGTARRKWRISSIDGVPSIEIYSSVTMAQAATLINTYLAMCPVNRLDNGTVITDTSVRFDAAGMIALVEDNSAAGFMMTSTTSPRNVSYSKSSKVAVETEMLEGWDKTNRTFTVSNSPSYNKHYYNVTGDYTTSVGELIAVRWVAKFP